MSYICNYGPENGWEIAVNVKPVNYPRTRRRIQELETKDLCKLRDILTKEIRRRGRLNEETKEREQEWLNDGLFGLSTLMASVAWALGCRAQLRWSKGHEPFGKDPAGGQMWYPWEIEAAMNKRPGAVQEGFGSDMRTMMLGKTVQQPYNNALKAKSTHEFFNDSCWPGIWLTPNEANKKAAPLNFPAERPSLSY
jgi:hypothetical protein